MRNFYDGSAAAQFNAPDLPSSPETETLLRELKLVAGAGDVPPKGHMSLAQRAIDEIERLRGHSKISAERGLSVLVKQYALDFRHNASGGDDYPYEYARATADYLEELIKRAKGNCTCAKIGFPDSCDNCDGLAQTAQQWQPIETAPKDGTNILVCRSMEHRSVGEAFFWEDRWVTWDGENHTRSSFIDGYLTHWQPMPDATTVSSTIGNSK